MYALGCFKSVAQVGNISQPELQVLYRGYDNKIIPNIPCGQQLDLDADGATLQKTSWTDGQGQTQIGYNVRVNNSANMVAITINGLNEKGDTLSSSTQYFQVKAFPTAQLLNDRVSKTSGMRVSVVLGSDSPFKVSFEVLSGSITIGDEELKFSGSVVPASLLKKAQVDQNVIVSVNYKRNGNSEVRTTSAVVKVVP